jgi:hypothetical protein
MTMHGQNHFKLIHNDSYLVFLGWNGNHFCFADDDQDQVVQNIVFWEFPRHLNSFLPTQEDGTNTEF